VAVMGSFQWARRTNDRSRSATLSLTTTSVNSSGLSSAHDER
jgi:hypothetical protein